MVIGMMKSWNNPYATLTSESINLVQIVIGVLAHGLAYSFPLTSESINLVQMVNGNGGRLGQPVLSPLCQVIASTMFWGNKLASPFICHLDIRKNVLLLIWGMGRWGENWAGPFSRPLISLVTRFEKYLSAWIWHLFSKIKECNSTLITLFTWGHP